MMEINCFQPNILEGMVCEGGCICGFGTIENMPKATACMMKENMMIATTFEKYVLILFSITICIAKKHVLSGVFLCHLTNIYNIR